MIDLEGTEWDKWTCPYCDEVGYRSEGNFYSDHLLDEHGKEWEVQP